MQRGTQADRGKEVRGRTEAPGDEKNHEVWDCLLGERMYGSDGLNLTSVKDNGHGRRPGQDFSELPERELDLFLSTVLKQ